MAGTTWDWVFGVLVDSNDSLRNPDQKLFTIPLPKSFPLLFPQGEERAQWFIVSFGADILCFQFNIEIPCSPQMKKEW